MDWELPQVNKRLVAIVLVVDWPKGMFWMSSFWYRLVERGPSAVPRPECTRPTVLIE